MIEEPTALTIRKHWPRPSSDQVRALSSVPTSFIADALGGGGAMDMRIKLLGDANDFPRCAAGPAVTTDNGPGDVLGTLAAITKIQPGDVLVAGFSAHQGCAAAGDRVMGMLKNAGGAALVTDGPVRDYAGIVDVGLPVWCTGLNPASPFSSGPATVGLPVNLGGQQVCSGDLIVADTDGVVVVPYEKIDAVIVRIDAIKTLEATLDAEVEQGLKTPDAILELLDGPQTTYIDV